MAHGRAWNSAAYTDTVSSDEAPELNAEVAPSVAAARDASELIDASKGSAAPVIGASVLLAAALGAGAWWWKRRSCHGD